MPSHPCQNCPKMIKKPDAPLCQRCAASLYGRKHIPIDKKILKKAQRVSVWSRKAAALAKRS